MTAQVIAMILAVGGLLPLITSIFQQPYWSNRTRTIVGIAASVLAGLVTYVTEYGLDLSSPATIITVVIGVILAAAASYNTVWKPSGVAPAIEGATIIKPKTEEVRDEVTPEPDPSHPVE